MSGKALEFDGRLSCFRHPDVSKARVAGVGDLVCVVCEAQWAMWAHSKIVQLEAENATLLARLDAVTLPE